MADDLEKTKHPLVGKLFEQWRLFFPTPTPAVHSASALMERKAAPKVPALPEVIGGIETFFPASGFGSRG